MLRVVRCNSPLGTIVEIAGPKVKLPKEEELFPVALCAAIHDCLQTGGEGDARWDVVLKDNELLRAGVRWNLHLLYCM